MITAAIIQARLTSTRLPGKVLMDIAGKPMLARVIDRVRMAASIDTVIVAVPDTQANRLLEEWCTAYPVRVFAGPEDDVLTRYQQAAHAYNVSTIVRITADCPLIDPAVIDVIVRRFQRGGMDYCSNVNPPTLPDGLDVEVFSRITLDRLVAVILDTHEHVTAPFRTNAPTWICETAKHEPNFSAHRWTVDTAEDLAFVRAVYEHFGRNDFTMQEVLAVEEECRKRLLLSPAPTLTTS